MAKQKTQGKNPRTAPKPQREIERLFAQYNAYHQNPTNKLLQKIFVPLFLLGLYGLMWALPFPQLKFLGKYAEFLNWASFLLAAAIFYYYNLSAVLSYFMLFTFFGFSYIITALQKWQQQDGGVLWQVSLLIFVIGLAGISLGYVAEKKNPGLAVRLKHLVIAPIYLWHLVLSKFSVKF